MSAQQPATASPPHPVLPAATRLGTTELVVSSLERSVPFYRDVIGLAPRPVGDGRVALASGDADVLLLHEDATAAAPGRHAGLYHVALLFPERRELARAALRLGERRVAIQGASDHGTHEAIYLADPDGIGLELAADRPRERWPDMRDPSAYAAGPEPLDQRGLLALVAGEAARSQAAPGVVVGHVHLHVGDLAAAHTFYTDVLGFETQVAFPSVAFVSAGGYHHHVAVNTWRGDGIPPAPDAPVLGLRRFALTVPTAADVADVASRVGATGHAVVLDARGAALRDPAGNAILIEDGGRRDEH